MTSIAWLGVFFVVLGIALKVLGSMGIIPGDIAYVSEVYGFGMLLLGKELWPGSAQSLAVKSRSIPPIAKVGLVLTLLLGGCSGVQLPQSQDALDARSALDDVADRLDARLTVARGLFDIASYGLDGVCGPTPSAACSKARAVLSTVGGHLTAADDAIDLYRETGQRFDAAHSALKEAERRVAELRALVTALRASLT